MRERLELHIRIINPIFLQLLQKNDSVTIHQRNLQVLVTEIFKAKNDLSTEIMKEIFKLKEPSCSLRSKED